MRVCRHCGQVAPDPANEPICHGNWPGGHSYDDVKPPRLTYEWFRDEMLKALPGIEPSPKVEAQIRDLWDLAHEAGRRASEVREEEEGAAKPSDSLLPPPTPETGRPLSPEDPTR